MPGDSSQGGRPASKPPLTKGLEPGLQVAWLVGEVVVVGVVVRVAISVVVHAPPVVIVDVAAGGHVLPVANVFVTVAQVLAGKVVVSVTVLPAGQLCGAVSVEILVVTEALPQVVTVGPDALFFVSRDVLHIS